MNRILRELGRKYVQESSEVTVSPDFLRMSAGIIADCAMPFRETNSGDRKDIRNFIRMSSSGVAACPCTSVWVWFWG